MRPIPTLARLFLLLALVPLPLLGQEAGPVAEEGASGLKSLPQGALAPARDLSLYQAEVTLISQSASERKSAAARALGQVMVKLTGNPQAAGNPVVRRAMPHAETYVTDSRASEASSDQEGNTAVGGVPVYKTVMSFAFDPDRMDALVAASGLNYWASNRPRPILWLAIDDGSGPRLVTGQQLAVVKPLAARGLERGLRFGMPAGSAIEQAAVQTIWAQNPQPMQPLTARYGNDSQLLGRLYRSGSNWTADWVLSQGDSELARWSYTDPSPQRAIASGADGAADAFARRDAVAMDVGEPGRITIEVAGLRAAGDYTRAMGYLQTLAVVRSVSVLEADADRLVLELDLAVGPEGFERFAAAGGVLRADPTADASRPRFLLQP